MPRKTSLILWQPAEETAVSLSIMGQKYKKNQKNISNAENTHMQVLMSLGMMAILSKALKITVVWVNSFVDYSSAGEW